MTALELDLSRPGRTLVAGVPEGYDALILSQLARTAGRPILHICRDDARMALLGDLLADFAPDVEVLGFPAWDTMPYDRVSPNVEIVSRRIDTLSRLAGGQAAPLVLTTVSAVTQRVPTREMFASVSFSAKVGGRLDLDALTAYLNRNGYGRAEQVMEPGEYAIRGGIVDLFPPGMPEPLRLDLFGDEIETIRAFDPMTQRSTGSHDGFVLRPMAELSLDEDGISRFRSRYRELFGTSGGDDPLYEAVSAGQKYPGIEHWLPLFHDGLDTLSAYLPDAAVSLDHNVDLAREMRFETIAEYYEARKTVESAKGFGEQAAVYHPVPPETLFLDEAEWRRLLETRAVLALTPFDVPDVGEGKVVDAQGRPGPTFAEARVRADTNEFAALKETVGVQRRSGRRVIVAAFSTGSRNRLSAVMKEHEISGTRTVDDWGAAVAAGPEAVPVVTLALERGFVTPQFCVIGEQDILGDRLVRPTHRKKKNEAFIADISALSEGDLVVHVDHGIGRFEGLESVSVGGAPHDCLRVIYDGGDKLFVPVENIEVLSRYGSEEGVVQLDRLGGVAWQARKAKLKQRIRDMADELIKVAAARHIKKAESFAAPEGLFDEFCTRFPYNETDDQLTAIEATLNDLSAGRPMDRLVCGDVGFGKTEVALRAAFAAAMSAVQVAVVVPTTLLARQHHKTFAERFSGLPIRVEQLSRMVTPKRANEVKQGLKDGSVNIVVGTHALLAKTISFNNLGLLIVDEEQHFGVAHKERLKQLKSDVHVLTLTATPIPRTLQLALTGVRGLSLIATPPVDRLAVRTFVLPFDPVVIREALQREKYRNGQTFYVCPRLADIDGVVKDLAELVPEFKVAVAHGQMAATRLEEVITAFSDGQYDILVSTNIIESGIDMPAVNTIILHRADMFGLSALYQLRGRVGRGKKRGYAYLTLPPRKRLTKAAEKRLEVMQTLDTLGAGFTLASHDLDIRGAGNLLGDEQSGHIKEVGVELYQRLLEEAVAAAREGGGLEGAEAEGDWSPQIATGMPVLIPEDYVKDLGLRLGLYRRIADLADRREIDELAAELEDRFGPPPDEVRNLLEVISLKTLCKTANVEKVDAGPKGAVLTLRGNEFPNPEGLVRYISQNVATVKIKPDQRIVVLRNWETAQDRMDGLQRIMKTLAEIAREG